jgi:hypothetical protein
MGKKARIKSIRKIAKELPDVMAHTQEKHFVLGAELIDQGITELNGIPVMPTITYEQMMPVMIATNHARKMKKLFNQYGKFGVLAYIDAVDLHLKAQEENV